MADFQNSLISGIFGVNWSSFFAQNNCNVPVKCFLAFLIFAPTRLFCKGYSLCIMADFQNGPTSRIVGVFFEHFFA